jgi:CheY-like chemotaxis protein
VEPSRLQGSMLKNGFANAGVATVDVVGSKADAAEAFARQTPDLLITAMQLPDGRGIDLLAELSRQARLEKTTAVLNSSDSTIDDLIAVGPAACLVLAPKKAKPDEILRVVHAAGPCVSTGGLGATPIDPLSLRVQIVTDFDRLPESLADLLRELKLLDIGVANALSPEAATAHLILLVRREDPLSGSSDFAAQAQRAAESGPLAAAIQVESGKLLLRAVSRGGVTAVCHRNLNARRLLCLLQGG